MPADPNPNYAIIYDGNCNLCTTLVQGLETLDRGQQFRYAPMQDRAACDRFNIAPEDCERGMVAIALDGSRQRWQGSDAAEEIARALPAARPLVDAYRAVPGLKALGDRAYVRIRDNRYTWFGGRAETYYSAYPACADGSCGAAPPEPTAG